VDFAYHRRSPSSSLRQPRAPRCNARKGYSHSTTTARRFPLASPRVRSHTGNTAAAGAQNKTFATPIARWAPFASSADRRPRGRKPTWRSRPRRRRPRRPAPRRRSPGTRRSTSCWTTSCPSSRPRTASSRPRAASSSRSWRRSSTSRRSGSAGSRRGPRRWTTRSRSGRYAHGVVCRGACSCWYLGRR
jgi:hypothetical protein